MGSSIRVQWSGVDGLVAHMQAHVQQMPKILAEVLMMEGEELIREAKFLTPVQHGFLVASGYVTIPEINGSQVSVLAGFGGVAGTGNVDGQSNNQDVGYALYVHEDLTKRHPVGQAKFLEQPFTERLAGMTERLAGRIEERLV